MELTFTLTEEQHKNLMELLALRLDDSADEEDCLKYPFEAEFRAKMTDLFLLFEIDKTQRKELLKRRERAKSALRHFEGVSDEDEEDEL